MTKSTRVVAQPDPAATVLVQRRADHGPTPLGEVPKGRRSLLPPGPAEVVLGVVGSSAGRPLDEEARRVMEARLSWDFSSVRVHTDGAAATSAAALQARAYTVGSSIVFGHGAYAPGSQDGRRTLVHELVHVRQQGHGPVAGTVVADGVAVSHPGDQFEREAESVAHQALGSGPGPGGVGGGAKGTPAKAAARAGPADGDIATVQRFQAGEYGHGGIEQDALQALHFSGSMTEGEIGAVYFGNWLRDFSQMGTVKTPVIMKVLNVLSMGEFNRPVTAEQLGGYLPSEHLDNPRGGATVEDTDPETKATTEAGLSTAQRQWVGEEKSPLFQDKMEQAKARTHLPAYIEAGKEHARREIKQAAITGRSSPEGLAALGNGLHAIEDYFAHSNFADACVYMLAAEGKLPTGSKVLAGLKARAKQFGYDPSGGVAGGASTPKIMTGTYRDVGNKTVSLLETLKTEVETGALRKAAVLGCIRLGLVTGKQEGGAVGRGIGGAVGGGIGAAAGVVAGAASGAAHEAAEGWKKGHGVLGGAWAAAKGLISGAGHGGAAGASSGWAKGSRIGAGAGAAVGEGVGGVIGAVAGTAVATVVGLISEAVAALAAVPVEAANEPLGAKETKKATANDLRHRDAAPNHSELAKDATDHPAYALARALAVHVDTEIGRAMVHAWDAHASDESIQQLQSLVDQFVSNPADKPWWRPTASSVLGARE